ncbi:MAG: DUF1353 domain-containing protein [Brevundimonas sp.]
MSRFTDATWAETGAIKNGRPVVCLTSPLAYEVGFLGSGWTISASVGFCTDLASLPAWFARSVIGRRLGDQIARSAIVHDRMRNDARWPKLLGDYVFFEAMGVDRVPLAWRLVCFAAVLVNFRRD